MKKLTLTLVLAILAVVGIAKNPTKVVLAYITSSSSAMPDPERVTHLNYAFGEVNSTFDGVVVQKPERLHQIVALKKAKPSLVVMLSIGGWTSGGFSEMARDAKTRAAFVADCGRVVDEFGLDGIDMDWEYPSSSAAGIASLPQDTDNFTLLIKELRAKLGAKKLVTFASVSSADFVDFKAILPYVDFINIMSYDMGAAPKYHHSALFPSKMTKYSGSQAIEAHLKQGVPPEKLTLGVPFYGHGDTKKGLPYFISYFDRSRFDANEKKWDDVAKVPYIVDEKGEMLFCFDDPRSLAIKCDYAKEQGLLGVMYWQYADDDPKGLLRDAVYFSLYPKSSKK